MNIAANQSVQRGVGLIEMMVALFVLAIGLLGILAMQAIGVKSTQRATFSTEAQIIAADMVDRILANNDIDDPADDAAYNPGGQPLDTVNANAAVCDVVNGCAVDNQVGQDLFEWSQIVSRLPAGRGIVEFNVDDGVYTISVVWDNELSRTNPTGNPAVDCVNQDLACYQVAVKI